MGKEQVYFYGMAIDNISKYYQNCVRSYIQ